MTQAEIDMRNRIVQAIEELGEDDLRALAEVVGDGRFQPTAPRLYEYLTSECSAQENRRRELRAGSPRPPLVAAWSNTDLAQSLIGSLILLRTTVTGTTEELTHALIEALACEAGARLLLKDQ